MLSAYPLYKKKVRYERNRLTAVPEPDALELILSCIAAARVYQSMDCFDAELQPIATNLLQNNKFKLRVKTLIALLQRAHQLSHSKTQHNIEEAKEIDIIPKQYTS